MLGEKKKCVCACRPTVKHSSPALVNLCLIYNCLSAQTQTHETVWSLDMSECTCVCGYVSCISIFVYTHKMYLFLDMRVWVDVCVPGSHGFVQLIFYNVDL